MYVATSWRPYTTKLVCLSLDVYATSTSMQYWRWVLWQQRASWRSVTVKCSSLMYPNGITWHFRSRQKAEKGDWVEWIKYLQPQLYLQSLDVISNASSDVVIIMRRLATKTVHPVAQRLLESEINGESYKKLFVRMGSGFRMAVKGRVTFRAGVLCSTVPDMSLMLRVLLILGLLSRESAIRSLQYLENDECRFTSLLQGLLWRGLEHCLKDILWVFSHSQKQTSSALIAHCCQTSI